MMDFKKKYNLRRRNVVVYPPKKALEGHPSVSHPTRNLTRTEVFQQKPTEKDPPNPTHPKRKVFQRKAYPKKNTCRKKK
jgi:hypothetical protein